MNFSRFNPLALAERLTGRPMAAATRHYFKDSIYFTAANVIPRLMGFILTPIVTSPGVLTTGEYNTFNVFSTAVITIVCILLSVQAENSVARYYYENKQDFPEFLGSLFLFTAVLSAVMFAQFWFFRDAWTWAFKLPTEADRLGLTMFLWGLGCAAAQILHQVYLQLLMARRQSRPYFFWSFFKQILYVGFGVYFLLAMPDSGVFGLVWAYAIATFGLALPFLIGLLRQMRPVFRWRHVGYALRFSLPGLPGILSLFIVNIFDRILFQHNNKDWGGQYSFAYQIGWLILMVTTGLFSAYMPRFYENMNKGEAEANQKLFARNLKLLLLGAVLLTLASQPMAHLLGRSPDYHKGLPIIPLIISAYLFMYLGQCYGLYIAFRRRYIWLQSISQIAAAAINVVLNVWIWQSPALRDAPLSLMRMAALATLLPYLVQWLIVYLVARHLLRERIVHFKGLVVPFGLFLGFAFLWSFFGYRHYGELLTVIQRLLN